jgi:hypothetical protein
MNSSPKWQSSTENRIRREKSVSMLRQLRLAASFLTTG